MTIVVRNKHSWMCLLKREQATRVSYNTLALDCIVEMGRKSRSWII